MSETCKHCKKKTFDVEFEYEAGIELWRHYTALGHGRTYYCIFQCINVYIYLYTYKRIDMTIIYFCIHHNNVMYFFSDNLACRYHEVTEIIVIYNV